ncbi:phage portal protein [Rhodovulum sulfidophilum]|uniref:Phage portal protein n=1 Tax=Rhodovulum visakhapatnamense TaxID=364297 RepID=A0ABS1RKX1_9RHOB|nr:phage portal protein [Rhodovulum visakhapatnamense]MBL3571528.1 phage portal protein [Rhodovulum visakhapatnamense]MBL3580327.1 phage portal protein [Rhodovulum visakhapatnamense]OLS46018.1 phage portal protein [Rhodovulum sulfidophilum]
MIGRAMQGAMRGAWQGLRQALREGESGWEVVSTGSPDPFAGLGRQSKAGQRVSATSALTVSAAWACVKGNSELIGALPVALYERGANGSRARIEADLAEILTLSPSAGQTAMEFWEAQVAHLLLQGNAYSEKLTVGERLVGLRPLFNVVPVRRDDGRFDYRVTEDGRSHVLPPSKVFHVRGFGGGDGLGMSAIRFGVQSFGSALAADETAARVFSNAMMPSGVIESDQTLTPDQRTQLGRMLEAYVSSDRAGKTLALEAGLKYRQLQMNPEDAQLLETRRFQVEDVCRWFGTPPVVIGHAAQGQTMWGTGVEAIMMAWLRTGINPLLRRLESRILKDLIPAGKRGRWFAEWNREAMLQMDSKAKGEFLSKMVAGGIMSSDEARDKLNLARRGGAADELRAQTALAPLTDLGKEQP